MNSDDTDRTEILGWAGSSSRQKEALICRACRFLAAGRLVAYPTETVYGLGADGLNPQAVRQVYAAKQRPHSRPLLLAVTGSQMLSTVVRSVPLVARRLMGSFWPGPLSLVMYRTEGVPDEVCAGGEKVGLRCPDNPVAQQLITGLGRPITAPSANISGRPSCTSADQVLNDLAGRIACIIDAGETEGSLESTVVDVTVHPPRLLRAGAITREDLQAVVGPVSEPQHSVGPQRSFRLVALLPAGAGSCSADEPPAAVMGQHDSAVIVPGGLDQSVLLGVFGDAADRMRRFVWDLESDGQGEDLHVILRRLQDSEADSVFVLLPDEMTAGGWRDRLIQMADDLVFYSDCTRGGEEDGC